MRTLHSASDFQTIFGSFSTLIISVTTFIGMVIFLTGLYGIYKRTENPNKYTLAGSFKSMLAGTLMMIMGTIYVIFRNTVTNDSWTANSREALSISTHMNESIARGGQMSMGQYLPPQMLVLIIGFLFVVGLYSFSKGLFMVKDVGGQDSSGQFVGYKKVINHLFFGTVCMNMMAIGPILLSIFFA
jgi:hypothetical protein